MINKTQQSVFHIFVTLVWTEGGKGSKKIQNYNQEFKPRNKTLLHRIYIITSLA